MPRLSQLEREGREIVSELIAAINQALDYETTDEDLPEQPEQLERPEQSEQLGPPEQTRRGS
jgi:hypothetical protein